MKTEKVSIKHSFTDQERLALGEDQSRKLMEKDTLEATLSATTKQIKADIDACQAGIRVISGKLSSRWEMRTVECILMDHRQPGMRYTVRLDNGHISSGRKLRPDESQMEITETPDNYCAIGLFPVDAENIDGDFLELQILTSEFESVRTLADVQIRNLPTALIGDAKEHHKAGKKK
jgi:hypothetical protein